MSLIDVRELIARYDHVEHVAKADAYFKKAAENPYYWRKPFFTGFEAGALLRGFAQVVASLDLYPGAALLDFGVGSCWSSRMFAYMGCRVTAVDVSVNALRLGETIIAGDPLRRDLDIRFLAYDGVRLPVADGSIDRIVCFDCFHHVPDQRATLAEFHRILRPGGFVGFSEPGPRHSLNEQSQFEMRSYGVIENDIDVAEIWRQASGIGFSELALSHAVTPKLVSLATFDLLTTGDVDAAQAKAVIDSDAANHDNARVFFLYKPGGPRKPSDSRSTHGLSHALSLGFEREGDILAGRLTVENNGPAAWLPSGFQAGSVNVGVQLFDAGGELIKLDYARIPIGDDVMQPGDRRELSFTLPAPAGGTVLVFNLVAEAVTWFDSPACPPIRIRTPG
jgi:SAM-dependent methyltransferase